jgi:hypothetical protein
VLLVLDIVSSISSAIQIPVLSFAVNVSILEISFVLRPIREFKLSSPMFLSVKPVTLVKRTVLVLLDPLPMLYPLLNVSIVFPLLLRIVDDSDTISLVFNEIPMIVISSSRNVTPFAMS